eukprot:SAG25_NODE_12206_length_285_cov_0.827957_1_plen_64_part_10
MLVLSRTSGKLDRLVVGIFRQVVWRPARELRPSSEEEADLFADVAAVMFDVMYSCVLGHADGSH